MQWPISLLVLVTVGGALSKSTTEKSPVTGQTTKRELLEGNFGLRTAVLNKYESPNITPGIQYADNLKQDIHEPSVLEQIFGSRVFPITKISDLLTGQDPPYDIALANHLYAPVSVYNAKLHKPVVLDLVSTTDNIKNHHFDVQKPKSEGVIHYYEAEISPKKTLSRNPNFHLPGILGPEFYTQESKYPQEFRRLKHFTTTRAPPLYIYKEQFNLGPFIPVGYNQQQSPVMKSEDLGFDYENQEASREYKDQGHGLHKVASTYGPDKQTHPLTGTQTYHAHPDGAISYSRFIYSQALLDVQPNYHKTPSNTHQQTFKLDFSKEENINVPEPPTSKLKDNLAPQQYVPLNQYAPFQRPLHTQKLSSSQFTFDKLPRHPEFYLHPKNNQFSHLRPKLALKSSENNQSSLKPLQNKAAKSDFLGHSTNNYTFSEKSIPNQTKFAAQPSTSDSFSLPSPYIPAPATVAYQSIATLSTAPAPNQSHVQITPKSTLSLDQTLQPTTIQPDIRSDATRDLKAEPKYLSQESSLQQTPQPTLYSILASPVTLQSLSPPQPTEQSMSSTSQIEILNRAQQTHVQALPHRQHQVQQQHLQEIHSKLAPTSAQDNSQRHLKKTSQENLQTTPQHEFATPQPTNLFKPDYEIEIATHVDHSQLPKDLQPVPTARETNNLVENHRQPGQESYSQNQTYVIERRPYNEPIQSFGEPPSYQNINYHDPNSLFHTQSLAPIQRFIQPRVFSNVQDLVLQPHFQQTPTFPPVQYFGKYAQSIFGHF